MTITEQIRMVCAKQHISQAELARRIGQTPQNFSARMKRSSFTIDELEKIADAAGAVFRHTFTFAGGDEI